MLVQLDDLGLNLLADVGLQVANATHLHQGGGQEAAQADVQDQAALDDLDDGTGDRLLVLLELLDRAPSALVLRTLLGQDQAAFLVFLGENQSVDLVADLNNLTRVNVVLDRQLAGRDDTLRLVSDVQQDLVVIDLDDGTLDNVTIVEVLDGGVDGSEEILSGANVVNGYLRDVVGGHMLNVFRNE